MDVFVVICYMILFMTTVYGLAYGMVRVLVPIVSSVLSMLLMMILKNWAFVFLFKWAIFQGDHITARVVVILLFFIIGSIGFRFLIKVLNIVSKLSIISGLNRILGATVGFVQGILIIWFLMYLIYSFPTNSLAIASYAQLQKIPFLTYLYDNNFVQFLFDMFTTMSI